MGKMMVLIAAILIGTFGCRSTPPVSSSGEIDDTNYLQSLFDSRENEIVIPAKDTPWITSPLYITASNKKIIFMEGCYITAKKGSFQNTGDCLITIYDSDNLVLEGNATVLSMQKKDYTGPSYNKGEWRHGISILKSSNIIIKSMTIRNTGGDGIYIGQNPPETVCENITLKNLILDNNHRQGISVTSVRNLLIDSCLVRGTKGTPPMAGIDFEPNSNEYGITGCVIRNCFFEKNSGAGIQVFLEKMTKTQPPVDIKIENTISVNNLFSVSVSNIPKGVTGNVVFTECTLSFMRWISVPKDFIVRFETAK